MVVSDRSTNFRPTERALPVHAYGAPRLWTTGTTSERCKWPVLDVKYGSPRVSVGL